MGESTESPLQDEQLRQPRSPISLPARSRQFRFCRSPAIDRMQTRELAAGLGPPGIGKTHLCARLCRHPR
jgi:hypothetical protein